VPEIEHPEPQVIGTRDRDSCGVVELALDHGERSQLSSVEREERFEVGPRKPLGEGECVEPRSACTSSMICGTTWVP